MASGPRSVVDIMTKDLISVHPDAFLMDVARLLMVHGLHGLPVVDNEKQLRGIVTDYDLISKNSFIHLPTLQNVMSQLHIEDKDRPEFEEQIKNLRNLRAKDVMNTEPLTLPVTASYEETVQAFRDHHRVNPIPVIDDHHKVVGVVSRFDLLRQIRNNE